MADDIKTGTVASPFAGGGNKGSGPVEDRDTGDERAFLDEGLDDEEEKDKSKSKSKSDVKDDEDTSESGDKDSEDEDKDTEDVLDEESDEESEDDDDKSDDTLSEEEKTQLESDNLYKSLKKADPEIFKKFPELKGTIFREREYSELFPTVKEAKVAAERSEVFAGFEADIMAGKAEPLLASIHKTDSKAVANFIENFLPAVEKLPGGNDLYFEAVAPVIKRLCKYAYDTKNEDLMNSAGWIHKLVFGDTSIERPYKTQPKEDPERVALQKEKEEFETRKYREFHTETTTSAYNILDKQILRRFEGSDFSPLMQKKLSDEIKERIGNSLGQDKRHLSNMDSLWREAKNSGYGNTFKSRIINTYLARAKALIPTTTAKVLSEAKGGKVVKQADKKQDVKRLNASNKTSGSGGKSTQKPDWSKMSEREFLES